MLFDECIDGVVVRSGQGSPADQLRGLVPDARRHLEQVLRAELPLQNLEDGRDLRGADVELIRDVLDSCALEQARLVRGNHVLEPLH